MQNILFLDSKQAIVKEEGVGQGSRQSLSKDHYIQAVFGPFPL